MYGILEKQFRAYYEEAERETEYQDTIAVIALFVKKVNKNSRKK